MTKAGELLSKLTEEGSVSDLGSGPSPVLKVITPRLAGVGKTTVLCPVCGELPDDCECKMPGSD